jgi:hypothetical protein
MTSLISAIDKLKIGHDLVECVYMATNGIYDKHQRDAVQSVLDMATTKLADVKAALLEISGDEPLSSGLADLITAHSLAYAAWCRCSDDKPDSEQNVIAEALTNANNQLLAHRPVSFDEVKAKGNYMASNECFTWSSVDTVELMLSLTPEVGL